jgi:hypothetical protein
MQSTNTPKVNISIRFNTELCETSLKELDIGGMKEFVDFSLAISNLSFFIEILCFFRGKVISYYLYPRKTKNFNKGSLFFSGNYLSPFPRKNKEFQ